MSSRSATPDAAAAVHIPDHTLLRVIGRGSYGEVWLARNVMGTHRAVKVVRRAAFDSDRPYLREFEGIRRCEPVSRAHDGLIDLLHMGRHDKAGFFYYVMELADAADGAFDVEQYRPATLSERISRGPRMEAGDCLRVAESLAGALAFLHEQGLIHRDVKPSNVMFVGGVPKLGDIGLVAEAGSSRSFVGTEGFVPQEGPGTERADIFALGKVLYETLTGMDRSNFPLLPQDWRQAYDFEQRVELNEIVMRACEGHPERRYFSAREVLADVALVASGKSVRKIRGMETRLRVLRWLGATAAAVALVALGVSWLWHRQAAGEKALRERAEQAESAEREARLRTMYSLVHSARQDPSPGSVIAALHTASEAAKLSVTPQLRDDAIFLLSRPDFLNRDDLDGDVPGYTAATDAESGMLVDLPSLVHTEGTPLVISLRRAGSADPPRTFTLPDAPSHLQSVRLSRGGRRLLISSWYGGGMVMDTANGSVLTSFQRSSATATPLVFCGGNGDAVIRRARDGGLAHFAVPGGEREGTPPIEDWPVRDQRRQKQLLWPSPDGRTVLLIDIEHRLPSLPALLSSILTPAAAAKPGAACLADVATGRILWKVSGPDEQTAAWSADGTRIAVRCGDEVVCLDAATGGVVATVPRHMHNRGTQLTFLGSRDHLAFATWSECGLCDLGSGELLCRPPVGGRWSYSTERRLLFAYNKAAEWRPSPVLQTFYPPSVVGHGMYFSFTPDEAWLIAGNSKEFVSWKMEGGGGAPAMIHPMEGATNVLFPGDGKTAHFLTSLGISEFVWTGQPPEDLPVPQSHDLPAGRRLDFGSMSTDGKVKGFGGYHFAVVLREGSAVRSFQTGDPASPVSVSPDGRWLAVGAQHSPNVQLWDLSRENAAPAHTEFGGIACFPAFSPDGKWLACSGSNGTRMLETASGSWREVHRIPRKTSGLIEYVSFTADSRLMAAKHTSSGCTIMEPGTWRELFKLTSPLNEPFERCGFSPGGRYFAAVGARREIYLWDLRVLAVELRKLGFGAGLDAIAEPPARSSDRAGAN